jgi:hypothetical protein
LTLPALAAGPPPARRRRQPSRLNDREVKDAEPLADGDAMTIGDVTLRVSLKQR